MEVRRIRNTKLHACIKTQGYTLRFLIDKKRAAEKPLFFHLECYRTGHTPLTHSESPMSSSVSSCS